MDTLQKKYKEQVIPQMMEKFGYKNPMAVPYIEKVTINSSFGKLAATKTSGERERIQNDISQDLALISGQRPKLIKSKKSIAGFKLRENIEIAAMSTLRRHKMWDFIERLIYLSLPRSRDFKGLDDKTVDQNGNMNIGFKEHINFPEIYSEKEKAIFGLQVTITTTAKNHEKGVELFRLMGFPMKEEK